MAYLSSDDIQDFLGLDLQPNGLATVTALIPAIGGYFETACNRTWNVTIAQTETFDGGQTFHSPKRLPIASVRNITAPPRVTVAQARAY